MKSLHVVSSIAVATLLTGCQTSLTIPSPPTPIPQHDNKVALKADKDSDGDGALDAIDDCPETPLNVVADERGCPVSVSTPMGQIGRAHV